jgi:hypothetical protein
MAPDSTKGIEQILIASNCIDICFFILYLLYCYHFIYCFYQFLIKEL